jgi:hypothetical protein
MWYSMKEHPLNLFLAAGTSEGERLVTVLKVWKGMFRLASIGNKFAVIPPVPVNQGLEPHQTAPNTCLAVGIGIRTSLLFAYGPPGRHKPG